MSLSHFLIMSNWKFQLDKESENVRFIGLLWIYSHKLFALLLHLIKMSFRQTICMKATPTSGLNPKTEMNVCSNRIVCWAKWLLLWSIIHADTCRHTLHIVSCLHIATFLFWKVSLPAIDIQMWPRWLYLSRSFWKWICSPNIRDSKLLFVVR